MNKPLQTGMEELRLLVKNFNGCAESFLDRFSAEELITLHRISQQSDWDFQPDRWEERQVQEALQGIVPIWDDQERTVYSKYKPMIVLESEKEVNVAGMASAYGVAVTPSSTNPPGFGDVYEYNVTILSIPETKVKVILCLRKLGHEGKLGKIHQDLGLVEAKTMTEFLPKTPITGLSWDNADEVCQALREAGAIVRMD